MSDYTQIFDNSVNPTTLIGQTTLSAIRNSGGAGLNTSFNPGISGNWYVSGTIFNSTAAKTTANADSTGILIFQPFYVTITTTYTAIGRLNSSGFGFNIVLGLYNDTGASAPTGSPIPNSNSTSIVSSSGAFGSYTFNSPITLTPGTYWCAYSVSGTDTSYSFKPANGLLTGPGGVGLGINGTPSTTNILSPQCGWSQSFVYSATLPAVGSLTAVNFNDAAGKSSFVFLRAQ